MEKLGVYLHVPFCRKKCAYCSFCSSPDPTEKEGYIRALIGEMRLRSAEYRNYGVNSVFFGGGTPSVLEPREFSELACALRHNFLLEPDCEFTVECNPESVSEEKLNAYLAAGVTRVSLGLQSLSNSILKTIGRLHDAESGISAVKLCRSRIPRVSVDFMLGLPGQRAEDIDDMLELVGDLGLRHVSAYGMKLEDGTPLKAMADSGEISVPDEDAAADLYERLSKGLEKLGLARYEISNFAIPGEECRHNLKYWRLQPYLGLGVAAHSYTGRERFYNGTDTKKYIAALSSGCLDEKGREKIGERETESEYVMLALRLAQGVDRRDYLARFGEDFALKYSGVLSQYRSFFHVDSDRVSVNSRGIYIVNSLLIKFV